MTGPLALAGGAEFTPGYEDVDRWLLAAGPPGPALVVLSAVRERPERALETAVHWFSGLGAEVGELPARTAAQTADPATAVAAERARLIYIAGGDPGRTVRLLRGSPLLAAMATAWAGGIPLAGSSAGAMALGTWSLVRDRWPDHDTRRPLPALGLVPGVAVLPHFDTFGHRWVTSARSALGEAAILVGVDEHTAAVWDGSGWWCRGRGTVTLIDGGGRRRSGPGMPVEGLPSL